MCFTANLSNRTGGDPKFFFDLFVAQSHGRINARGTLRRNHARQQSNQNKRRGSTGR